MAEPEAGLEEHPLSEAGDPAQMAGAGLEEDTGPGPVCVEAFPAKPNKMFSAEITQLVAFLRYTQAVPCAECGKRSKHHWTMRCSFEAHSMKPGMFTLAQSGTVHLPLAPVCRAHLLAPSPLPAVKGKRRG